MHARATHGLRITHVRGRHGAIGRYRREIGRNRDVIGIDLDQRRRVRSAQDQHVARGAEQGLEQHRAFMQVFHRARVADEAPEVLRAPDQLVVGVRRDGQVRGHEEEHAHHAGDRERDPAAQQHHAHGQRAWPPARRQSGLPVKSPGASPNA